LGVDKISLINLKTYSNPIAVEHWSFKKDLFPEEEIIFWE